MNVVITTDGEQPSEVEWPEGWPIPRVGDRVSLPESSEPLSVRVVEWYPQGDEDHAEAFVYLVIGKRREWIIEVCRTCARIANWPFCEHRQQWLDAHPRVMASTPSWTELVRVKEASRFRR